MLKSADGPEETSDLVKNIPHNYINVYTLNKNLNMSNNNLSILQMLKVTMPSLMNFKLHLALHLTIILLALFAFKRHGLGLTLIITFFDLPNYHIVSKGNYCSHHGGLLIYVPKDFGWEPLEISVNTTGLEMMLNMKLKKLTSKLLTEL